MKRNLALSFRREGYEALLSLFDSVREGITINELCAHALGIIQQVTGFDTIVVRVYDPHHRCHRLVAQSGMTPEMVKEVDCLPLGVGFCGDATTKGWPIFTTDIPTDPRTVSPATHREGFKSLASAPLLAGEQLKGTIELISKDVIYREEDELSWLALMGRGIGSLINQLQLVEHLRSLAVLDERARLAREIHDGAIQMLGTLNFWTEEAEDALEQNNLERLKVAVKKSKMIAQDAYAGFREEVLGLRARVNEGKDILLLLHGYLDRFQRMWGIEAHLEVCLSNEEGDGLNLNPMVEVQLLRIIQESLTNVRRHAQASKVVVRIYEKDETLDVSIQDNGRGFDPDKVSLESLGLRIMRERGRSAGGDVQITSRFGQGTIVEAKFPLMERIINNAKHINS